MDLNRTMSLDVFLWKAAVHGNLCCRHDFG
jgi:hypothetical protein